MDAIPKRKKGQPGWRLFFEFLAHSGLRISEAFGLTWAHVELGERPHIEVREQFYGGWRRGLESESGRRETPLSAGMAARLLAHRRDTYGGPQAAVFPSQAGDAAGPRQGRPARTEPRPRGGRHGVGQLPHLPPHLRVDAVRGRSHVKQVAEWLGHADPAFTLRTYVHLMDAGVGGAEFFDEAVHVSDGSASTEPRDTARVM